MRKTLAALVLASVAASTPVLAQPARSDAHLVVSASRSASQLFRVSVPVRIADLDQPGAAHIKASGRYGGLLIYRAGHLVTGVVLDRDLGFQMAMGRPSVTLKPGMYRLVALADKPMSVDLSLRSPYSYSFAATGPASVHHASVDASPAAPAGVGYAKARLAVDRSSTVIVGYRVDTTAAQAGQLEVCAEPKVPAPCAANDGGFGVTMVDPGSQYDAGVGIGIVYPPGSLPAGKAFACGDDQMAGAQNAARLVAFVVS